MSPVLLMKCSFTDFAPGPSLAAPAVGAWASHQFKLVVEPSMTNC